MAQYKLQYDASLAGAKLVYHPTKGTEQAATSIWDQGTVWSLTDGMSFILTGYYWVLNGARAYMQTTSNGALISADISDDIPNWIIYRDSEKIRTVSDTYARQMIQRIIDNDKQIICNNLCLARFANKLSQAQRQQVRDLQNRLTVRQSELINGGIIEDVRTNYPAGYAELSAYLDKLMAGEAIGIAPIVYVIVAFAIAAGTGTAVYFGYKYFYDESERDIQYSKQLMAVLQEKLTPEEYQQLLNETKNIVTKARIKQAAGSYWNVLKYAALAFAGYSVYQIIKSKRQ